MAELARGYASLADRGARAAFAHTLRSIVDPSGQRVSARDRLYLASEIPTQIVWGERDLDDPSGFVRIMRDFVFDTDPAWLEADDLRQRVLQGH